MKRTRLFTLFAFLFSGVVIFASDVFDRNPNFNNLPRQAQQEILINQALIDLHSLSMLERRGAVRVLAASYNAPGIQRVVFSLEEVLLETNRSDSIFTRSIAAEGLGKMAKSLGPNPWGNRIVETLSLMSDFGKFDLVRASAVRGLGESGNDLAIDPLVRACDDPSLLVSGIAGHYLFIRTGDRCGEALTASARSLSANETESGPTFDELDEYVKRHFILLP